MRLLLLHGPNLQLLGQRPGDEVGTTLEGVEAAVREEAARNGAAEVRALQSNHEGALLDALHGARAWASGVVLNPGLLGHTSQLLREAVACAGVPVVEVQLDVPAAGEPWRQVAVLEGVAARRITGRGLQGYVEAVRWLAGRAADRSEPGGQVPPHRALGAMPVVTGSAVTVFAGAAASARQRGMERVAGSLQAGEGLLPGAPVDAALERGAVRAAGAAQAAGGLPPGEPVDVALERGATQFPAVRAAADVADPAVPGGSVTGPGSEDCAALPGAVAPPRTSDGQGAEAGGLSASSAMALGGEVRRTAAPGTLRGRGREAASEGAAGLRSGPSLLVPASPSVSARECAFCADEPCELHAGAPVVPARSAGLGLAGEAMMRLRALEAESLLFETDQSIAALKGEALSSEARLAAVLGVAEVRTAGARAATHGTKGPGLEAEDAAPAGDEAAPSRTSGISPPTHRAGAGALTPPVAEGASVRKSMGPAVTAAGAAPRKTLGRAHTPRATESAAQHGKAPLRAQLAQKLAAHLAGALSAAELAAFAREGWMAQGDDAALESALRQLMFQDRPGAALDVDALVSLLASLQ